MDQVETLTLYLKTVVSCPHTMLLESKQGIIIISPVELVPNLGKERKLDHYSNSLQNNTIHQMELAEIPTSSKVMVALVTISLKPISTFGIMIISGVIRTSINLTRLRSIEKCRISSHSLEISLTGPLEKPLSTTFSITKLRKNVLIACLQTDRKCRPTTPVKIGKEATSEQMKVPLDYIQIPSLLQLMCIG